MHASVASVGVLTGLDTKSFEKYSHDAFLSLSFAINFVGSEPPSISQGSYVDTEW